jgi:hypothetical protein
MRTVGLAAFRFGASLLLLLSLCIYSHGGTPLGPRGNTFATSLERPHREQPMAGTFTSFYRCEEFLPFQGICTTYCTLPPRARREKGDRSITRPEETCFGRNSSVKTRQESHWEVRCSTTALQSPYNYFPMGERRKW